MHKETCCTRWHLEVATPAKSWIDCCHAAILNSVGRMASAARQDGAGHKTSVLALPVELLELICSFLEDADDLASCHMVDTRCAIANVHLTTRSAPQMLAPQMLLLAC